MKDIEKFISMVENSEKKEHWGTSLFDSVKQAHKACVEAEEGEEKTQLDMLADTFAKIMKAKDKAKYDKFVQVVEKHYPQDSIKMFKLVKEKALRIAKGAEPSEAEKVPAEEEKPKKTSPEEGEAQKKEEKGE